MLATSPDDPGVFVPRSGSSGNRLRPVGFRSGHCGSPLTGALRPEFSASTASLLAPGGFICCLPAVYRPQGRMAAGSAPTRSGVRVELEARHTGTRDCCSCWSGCCCCGSHTARCSRCCSTNRRATPGVSARPSPSGISGNAGPAKIFRRAAHAARKREKDKSVKEQRITQSHLRSGPAHQHTPEADADAVIVGADVLAVRTSRAVRVKAPRTAAQPPVGTGRWPTRVSPR